jgi:hypothetical protein
LGQHDQSLKTQTTEFPSPHQQRARIRELLDILDHEPLEPSDGLVEEARELLAKIETLISNHEEFVASGFQHCFPAWHELLKGANRKSAKLVLSWLRNGFRPKFVGTSEVKPDKRKAVIAMLAKLVPGKEIPGLLTGKFPHRIEFENHQWGFSSEQIVKVDGS